MKRSFLIGLSFGFVTALVLGFSNIRGFTPPSPVRPMMEAYSMALEALGKDTNELYCVEAKISSEAQNGGEWIFTFKKNHMAGKVVHVAMKPYYIVDLQDHRVPGALTEVRDEDGPPSITNAPTTAGVSKPHFEEGDSVTNLFAFWATNPRTEGVRAVSYQFTRQFTQLGDIVSAHVVVTNSTRNRIKALEARAYLCGKDGKTLIVDSRTVRDWEPFSQQSLDFVWTGVNHTNTLKDLLLDVEFPREK